MEKTNDWVATLLYNPDLDYNDFNTIGVTADNTAMKSADDYKKLSAVREADVFKDSAGNFDEKKFDNFYNNALALYNDFSQSKFVGDIFKSAEFGRDAWYAPLDSAVRNEAPLIYFDDKQSDVNQGVSYITKTGVSNLDLSDRELGQREKVVDYETGETLDYTPNERGAFGDFFNRPTLVLAQYEEDVYDDNGELIHRKGENKLNENNRPYYETLGNREIYGKDVLKITDVLTVDGSKWNKLDFFDSDDKRKSFGKVAAKTIAQIAPMFLGPVGTVYGVITGALALNQLLPELGKAIDSLVTSSSDNQIGKALSKWEGFASQFGATQSDWAREKWYSIEGLSGMVGAVTGQLFQQRIVGNIPNWLHKSQELKKDAELGRKLSFAYMAATSSQGTYEDFQQAGASDFVSGLGMIGYGLALNKLMQIDYFRDKLLFKGTFMDEAPLKNATKQVMKDVDKGLINSIKEGSSTIAENAVAVNKFKNFFLKKLPEALSKNDFWASSVSEGVEETMEEFTLDTIKGLTAALKGLGIPVEEKDQTLDFGFSAKDIATRYLSNFAGGFIGGGVFYGQGKFENWGRKQALRQKFGEAAAATIDPDAMQQIIYALANGQGDEVRTYFKKWHKRGIIGNPNLKVDSKEITTVEGTKSVFESAYGDSVTQNDAVYNTVLNMVDSIEQLLAAENYDFSEANLQQVLLQGYTPDENALKANALINIGSWSNFRNDVYKTISELISEKAQLNTLINSIKDSNVGDTSASKENVEEELNNNKQIEAKKKRIKELEQKRDELLSGKKNRYYSGQGFFAADTNLNKLFTGLSKEAYIQVKYNRDYNSASEEEKKQYDQEYSLYEKTEGRNQVYKAYDLYLDLSNKYRDFIKEKTTDLTEGKLDTEREALPLFNRVITLNDEIQKLQQQIAEIDQTTAEGVLKVQELNNKIKELKVEQNTILKNPAVVLGFALKNHDNLLQFLQASAENSESTFSTFATTIENMYKDAIVNNTFVKSDSEYDVFVQKVVSSLIKNIEPDKKVRHAITNFVLSEAEKLGISEPEGIDSETDSRLTWAKDGKPDIFIIGGYAVETDENGNVDIPATLESQEEYLQNSDNIDALIDLYTKLVNNIGIDNQVAYDTYQKILNLLRSETTLSEEQIKSFITDLIPEINGENFLDWINRIEDLKSKVKRNIFVDMLTDFEADLGEGHTTKLLDIVNELKKAVSNSSNLSDFIIKNPKYLDALNIKDRIQPISNILLGMLRGSADGTNSTINSFKGTVENESDLFTIDENSFRILKEQAKDFQFEIATILDIHDINSRQALRIQKDIEINMRQKFIKVLVDKKNVLGINVEELWDKVKGDVVLSNDSITEDNYPQAMDAFVKFETALYNEMQAKGSEYDPTSELLELLGEKKYVTKSTNLTKEPDEIISNYDLVLYLAQCIAMPSDAFYAKYQQIISNQTFDKAPIFSQEWSVRLAIANLINPNRFNKILDAIQTEDNFKNVKSDDQKYLANKATLHNMSVILGSAGTGKTMGILRTFLSFLDPENAEIVFGAPKQTQIDHMLEGSKGVLDDVETYTKEKLISTIFGETYTDKVFDFNEDTTHLIIPSTSTYGQVFKTEKKIKVLVLDEIGRYNEIELQKLSMWAKSEGIFILGLGDTLQSEQNIDYKNKSGKQLTKTSGLEDCTFIKSPYLTASLRTSNLGKYTMFLSLYNVLSKVKAYYEENPELTDSDLSNKTSEMSKGEIHLSYYEDETSLKGDKVVESKEDLIKEAQKLVATGASVAIIADDVSKYSAINGVEVIQTDASQGGEWDYVIVDTDFVEKGKNQAYNILRDLYTLTQRSRRGSVILKNNLDDKFKILGNKSDPKYNVDLQRPEGEQNQKFKEWKLSTLPKGSDDLVNEFDTLLNGTSLKTGGLKFKEPDIPTQSAEKPISSKTSESIPNSSSETTIPPKPILPIGGATVEAEVEETTDDETPNAENTIEPTEPTNIDITTVEPKVNDTTDEEQASVEVQINPTDTIFSMQEVIDYFVGQSDIDFIKNERARKFSLLNLLDNDFSAKNWKTAINYLSSVARLGLDPSKFDIAHILFKNDVVAADEFTKLFLMDKPQIYIVENTINYGNKSKIITARYYNKQNSSIFFDVPIGFIDTNVTGKYTGTIDITKYCTYQHNSKEGNPLTYEEFLARNPGLQVSQPAVLAISEDDVQVMFPDIAAWVNNPKVAARGKVMIGLSYEIAANQAFFEKLWSYDENGWAHKFGRNIHIAGFQKSVNTKEVVFLAQKILAAKGLTTISENQKGYVWEQCPSEATINLVPDLSTFVSETSSLSTSELKQTLDENPYQILNRNNSGKFAYNVVFAKYGDPNAIEQVKKNIRNIFLNSKLAYQNKKTGEPFFAVHGLMYGNQVLIKPIFESSNNKMYRIVKYEAHEISVNKYGQFQVNPVILGEINSNQFNPADLSWVDMSKIEDTEFKPSKTIHLLNIVTNTNTNVTSYFLRSPNDLLGWTTHGFNDSWLDDIDANYANKIYLQDVAGVSFNSGDNLWRRLEGNTNGLYVDIDKVNPEQYKIDISKVEPDPNAEASTSEVVMPAPAIIESLKNRIEKLDILSKYDWNNFNGTTIEEANQFILENANDLTYEVLHEENGELIYTMKDYTDPKDFIAFKAKLDPKNINVVFNNLQNWNYAVFSVTSQGNTTYQVFRKSKNGDMTANLELTDIVAYTEVMKNINNYPKDIAAYFHSLHFNTINNPYVDKFMQYMKTNPIEAEKILNYLQSRIENGECW